MTRTFITIIAVLAQTFVLPAAEKPRFIRFPGTCDCGGKRIPCFGYRDADGNVIVPAVHPWLDADSVYAPHTYVITCDGRFTAVDTAGKALFDFFPYDNGPDYFSEGLARFVKDGKVGYVDTAYTMVIPAQYDFATPFSHGRAAFCNGCGKVPMRPDHPGETPLPEPEYHRYSGGTWGFIDRSGNVIVDPVPGDVVRFDDTTTTVESGDGMVVRRFESSPSGNDRPDGSNHEQARHR